MYYGIRLFLSATWIAGLVAGVWWSLRLARADALFRRSTPQSVTEAVRLAPGNSAYQSLHALQIDYAGGDPAPVWRALARRRPTDASSWILLGLREEAEGRFDQAERDLLEAASVNAQYEPRWTLANFYFRRGRTAEFNRWAGAAMDRMYDDPRPLFDLSARLGGAPLNVPSRLRGSYALWLLQTQKPDAAAAAAESLRPVEDREVILGITEALLPSHPGAAFRIWQTLAFTPSPDFQPLLGRGFDWRISTPEGIRSTPTEEPSLRIVFDGKQPDAVEILWRVFPRNPGVTSRFRWQSRTSAARGFQGVAWRSGESSAPLATSDSWTGGEMQLPASSEPARRLSLFCQRPAGSPRFDGTLWLRHVALEAELK